MSETAVSAEVQTVSTSVDRSEPALLEVENLSVTIHGDSGDLPIIPDVSFRLKRGEIVGLAGESGSGKSITAMALIRLLPRNATTSGRVTFLGQDVLSFSQPELQRFRANSARVIFQDPWMSMNPLLTIGRQLASSITAQTKVPRDEVKRRSIEMLEAVGIPEPERRLKQRPHEFSGGMLQRIMIALALVVRPELLICDEPTTALDVTTEAQIVELLEELNREFGTAIIFTSHDLSLLRDVCQNVMVMYSGRIIEQGRASDVLNNPVHPYTSALLDAVPGGQEPHTPLRTIEGGPPRPEFRPSGCAFHPRCPLAEDRCRGTQPPEFEVGPDGRTVRCLVKGGSAA